MKKKVIEDEKLINEAQKYFSDDYSELEPDRIKKLKNKVLSNKTSRKNIWIKSLSISSAMCCLIVLCIVLPITLKQEPLYTYSDLIREEMSLEDSKNYIEKIILSILSYLMIVTYWFHMDNMRATNFVSWA